MIKKRKPTVSLMWHKSIYDFISVIMPVLKKAGMIEEAKNFIKEIRENNYSKTKSIEIARKYVRFKESEVLMLF